MKKIIICLFICLFLFTGCSGNSSEVTEPNTPVTEKEEVDLEGSIIEDSLESEGALGEAISDNVEISVASSNEETVTVSVKAPYIYDELYAWFDSLEDEDYSDKAIEEKIKELLGGAKTEYEFTLEYELVDELVSVSYTDEYYDAVSCGISKFYSHIFEDYLAEMEASLGGGIYE